MNARGNPDALRRWRIEHPEEAKNLGRRAGDANRGRSFEATGAGAAGPNNAHRKAWSIKSPRGVAYEFENLQEFVRQNEHLFDAIDVIKRTRVGQTNAALGISFLRPGRKHRRGSWKGWTWNGAETP